MESGAQPGNKNAAKAKRWAEAIKRALARAEGDIDKGLDSLADKMVKMAIAGTPWAIEHIAERIDGKVKQVVEGRFEHEHTVVTGDSPSLRDRLGRKPSERAPQDSLN